MLMFEKRPELRESWDYSKNTGLDPETLLSGSNKNVWWLCVKGHSWQAPIWRRAGHNNRVPNNCPFCTNKKLLVGFNDLASQRPDLAEELNSEKNDVHASEVLAGSGKKLWWKCSVCNASWQATVSNRVKGNSCPVCNKRGTSKPEQGLCFYLSQVTEVESRFKFMGKEVDVYLPKYNIGIEYDGIWHKSRTQKDEDKEEFFTANGMTFFRLISFADDYKVEGNHIFFNDDSCGLQYDRAVTDLLSMISKVTGNKAFAGVYVNSVENSIAIAERVKRFYKENSVAVKAPELVKEWNWDKNGTLSPSNFSFGSGESVWWKCHKGHEWVASVVDRKHGNGCPFCANLKIAAGDNDLASNHPELLKQWDFERNVGIDPKAISSHSGIKVWWKCEKGHSWNRSVHGRFKADGTYNACPVCANRTILVGFNDLATTHTELVKEWKDGQEVLPTQVLRGSNYKAVWVCKDCDHEWKASVKDRVRGTGCPACRNKKVAANLKKAA